jgi:hypothetical protein
MIRSCVAVATIVGLSAVHTLSASCVETLSPTFVRELPQTTLKRAHSVAWIGDRAVAVGSDNGVYEYVLADSSVRRIVAPRPIPNGLSKVEDIATDGRSLVAFNLDYSQVAVELASSRIVAARRAPALEIIDLAVRGDSFVVLGFPAMLKKDKRGVLWMGKVGAEWESFRMLHKVRDDNTENLRSCLPPFGGAVVIQKDGTIAMITATEAGIHRFSSDGTRLATLGSGLTDLVVNRIAEIREIYASDVIGRYREVLNQQPTADDLVDTANGLAIVVRRTASENVWWELWFPAERTGTRRRIRLAVEDKRTAGGHLRCHGRGQQLACLFGKSTELFRPDRPYLMVFDLNRVTRKGKCGT